jgi:hypothetical protein
MQQTREASAIGLDVVSGILKADCGVVSLLLPTLLES